MSTLIAHLPHDFALRLIAWQRLHGRHHLPWQGGRDAYRIWLSEIMLQQTQVSAVIPYFLRFVARFPSLADLAAAPQNSVLEAWAGLGYYARARNLHRCAQMVMEQHEGVFPSDLLQLIALPGIGRSTAAAIAVFSAGRRAAILDGNVKRVLSRHLAIDAWPGLPAVERELWLAAETLLPETGIEAYTQGLMDLGATICTRTQARCADCPVADDCQARIAARQDQLPVSRPRKALPERFSDFVLISDGRHVLLQRRPPSGLWGGLLVPPEGEAACILAALGMPQLPCTPLPALIHNFTHFRLHLQPLLYLLENIPSTVMAANWHWQELKTIESAALPTPIKKLLLTLRSIV